MAKKSSEYELAIKIAGKVDSSLKAATKNAQKEVGSLSTNAKSAFKSIAIAGAAITTAAVAAGKALYDIGKEFDAAYDAIRIGTGATGEALDDLKESMQNVYASVPTDMASAAAAISDYNTRLGLTGDELETVSKQALQVSKMLGEDLDTVIESSSKSFQVYNLDASQMAESMDFLFKVSQSTGIGFSQLTQLVQNNGVAFQQMGFSYNESAAMLGKLEKAGYKASSMTTAMNTAVKTAAKMGLSSRDAYEKYYKSILSAKTETDAIRISMELFGSKSGAVMAQAIRDGTLAMSDFMGQLEGSGETIDSAAADTYGLAEKWTMFTNRMKIALQPMATTLFDSLAEAADTVLPIVEALLPYIVDALGAIIHLGQQLAPILISAFNALAPIISNVTAIFSNLIDFISNVFAGNWSAAWESIVAAFAGIWDTIKELFKAPINAVISMLNFFISKLNTISIGPLPNWSILGEYAGAQIGFDIPEIAYLAQGGIVTQPTMSMVGEGGEPEAVLPLSKLAGMLGGSGVSTQTDSIAFSPVFNFYGSVTKAEAEEAGRISFEEFKRLYMQMRLEEKRKSFSYV